MTLAHGRLDGSALTVTGLILRPNAAGRSPLLLSADPLSFGTRDRRLVLSAELSREGYALHLNGSGALDALQAAALGLRLPTFPSFSAQNQNGEPEAAVEMSLTDSGRWNATDVGGESPTRDLSGTADFEHVRWMVPMLPLRVDFGQLHAALSPGLVAWTTPDASVGAMTDDDARTHLAGDVQTPLRCAGESPCAVQFHLQAGSLDAAAVQALFRSGVRSRFPEWLDRFDPSHASLPAITGTLRAGTLTLGRLPVRDALLSVATAGKDGEPAIRVESLDGRVLGGSLHMEGLLRLPPDGAPSTLHATLTGASAAQAAALWHESWGPGTLGGEMEMEFSGYSTAEILAGAKGSFRASWLRGSLQGLPPFASWNAEGAISADGLHLQHGALSSPPAQLDGRIGWDRSLALRFTPGDETQSATVTGTVAAPLVSPAGTDAP